MAEQKDLVFISYSHQNRVICDSIALLLESLSLEVWYDDGLMPGDIYRKKIVNKIRAASYFIVLLSDAAIRSEWVIDEIEYAKKQHKRIIPVFLEETNLSDDLDMMLQRYQSLFWYLRGSDQEFERSFRLLLAEDSKEAISYQNQGSANLLELSEGEVKKIKELSTLEKQGVYSKCYTSDGACLLGRSYLSGNVSSEDRKKAEFYFKVAKYYGNLDGAAYLIYMRLHDQKSASWDEPDEEFCAPLIAELKQLVEQGSEAAMMVYANILWYGRYGCQKDVNHSAGLYEICAKHGSARAQYMMASNYYNGDGVPKDYDLAIMYAHLAAEQNYAKSWRRLGEFYCDGLAVPQDYQKSREYYMKGAQAGDCDCFNKIGDMYYYGQGVAIDYKQAVNYYLKGEEAPINGQKYGRRKAKRALGRCYELGKGVDQNLETAVEKYLEGYRLGSGECKKDYLRLATQLRKGHV